MERRLRCGDRVEIIEEVRTWNNQRILAKVGQNATVDTNEWDGNDVRIVINGHRKELWVKPKNLRRII